MILACHQPNFLPYMGFFKKMYQCDVFTLSNTVQFTRNGGYHNYNFFNFGKASVPVDHHSGKILDVRLAQNYAYERDAFLKKLRYYYAKAPHFNEIYHDIESVMNAPHTYLWELNAELIAMIHDKMGMKCPIVPESLFDLPDSPNEAIIYLCQKLGCEVYLSGEGARDYLEPQKFANACIELRYSHHDPEKYPRFDNSGLENLSVLDYLMNCGYKIPEEWKQ